PYTALFPYTTLFRSIIVTGAAGPPHSVGGLRQGATRFRSVPGAAGPPHSVGGRRTDRPSSAGFARATDPGGGSEGAGEAPFDEVGGLRQGATRLRSASRISFHRARHS